jgi:hypothetical protein
MVQTLPGPWRPGLIEALDLEAYITGLLALFPGLGARASLEHPSTETIRGDF